MGPSPGRRAPPGPRPQGAASNGRSVGGPPTPVGLPGEHHRHARQSGDHQLCQLAASGSGWHPTERHLVAEPESPHARRQVGRHRQQRRLRDRLGPERWHELYRSDNRPPGNRHQHLCPLLHRRGATRRSPGQRAGQRRSHQIAHRCGDGPTLFLPRLQRQRGRPVADHGRQPAVRRDQPHHVGLGTDQLGRRASRCRVVQTRSTIRPSPPL